MDTTESMDAIVNEVSAWEGVLTLRPGPGDGSPEISWGDVFFYVAPDGRVPVGQPFATIITKDYPGEPSPGLDHPGRFRVNIAASRSDRSGADTAADPSTPDRVMPHPTYADQGWVAVVNPGERTHEEVVALLQTAHRAALDRWHRRRAHNRPSPVEDAS